MSRTLADLMALHAIVVSNRVLSWHDVRALYMLQPIASASVDVDTILLSFINFYS